MGKAARLLRGRRLLMSAGGQPAYCKETIRDDAAALRKAIEAELGNRRRLDREGRMAASHASAVPMAAAPEPRPTAHSVGQSAMSRVTRLSRHKLSSRSLSWGKSSLRSRCQ